VRVADKKGGLKPALRRGAPVRQIVSISERKAQLDAHAGSFHTSRFQIGVARFRERAASSIPFFP
jgi:hypothetical protein